MPVARVSESLQLTGQAKLQATTCRTTATDRANENALRGGIVSFQEHLMQLLPAPSTPSQERTQAVAIQHPCTSKFALTVEH